MKKFGERLWEKIQVFGIGNSIIVIMILSIAFGKWLSYIATAAIFVALTVTIVKDIKAKEVRVRTWIYIGVLVYLIVVNVLKLLGYIGNEDTSSNGLPPGMQELPF